MMDKFVKGYYIKRDAYYYVPNIETNDEPEIMIGLYNNEGGCRFEFRIVETAIGLRLKMYDESWIAFVEFPSLFERLARLVKNENFEGAMSALGIQLNGEGINQLVANTREWASRINTKEK